MASSLEINKMMAAVLTAGIIASGAGVISRIIYGPQMPEEQAYPIAVAEGEAAAAGRTARRGAADRGPAGRGRSGAGESSVARECAACHSFEQGGANKVGPGLWGVVGRDGRLGRGLQLLVRAHGQAGRDWDYEASAQFLDEPQGMCARAPR